MKIKQIEPSWFLGRQKPRQMLNVPLWHHRVHNAASAEFIRIFLFTKYTQAGILSFVTVSIKNADKIELNKEV